jgi:hypothetical protein
MSICKIFHEFINSSSVIEKSRENLTLTLPSNVPSCRFFDLEGMVHTPELAPVSLPVYAEKVLPEIYRGMDHAIQSNYLPNDDTPELLRGSSFYLNFSIVWMEQKHEGMKMDEK